MQINNYCSNKLLIMLSLSQILDFCRLFDKMSMRVGASFNYDNDKMLINGNRVSQAIRGNHIKLKFSNRINEKIKINYGVEYLNNSFTQRYQDQKDSIENAYNNNTYAVFTEADIYTSSKFVIRAGLRSSYADHIDKFNVAPRFSMAYKLNKETQII